MLRVFPTCLHSPLLPGWVAVSRSTRMGFQLRCLLWSSPGTDNTFRFKFRTHTCSAWWTEQGSLINWLSSPAVKSVGQYRILYSSRYRKLHCQCVHKKHIKPLMKTKKWNNQPNQSKSQCVKLYSINQYMYWFMYKSSPLCFHEKVDPMHRGKLDYYFTTSK